MGDVLSIWGVIDFKESMNFLIPDNVDESTFEISQHLIFAVLYIHSRNHLEYGLKTPCSQIAALKKVLFRISAYMESISSCWIHKGIWACQSNKQKIYVLGRKGVSIETPHTCMCSECFC